MFLNNFTESCRLNITMSFVFNKNIFPLMFDCCVLPTFLQVLFGRESGRDEARTG